MSKTILVVDDKEINRLILRRILGGDYVVAEAADGQGAMDYLTRQYHSVSAVLLDIVMPVMDGYAVLGKMRANPILSQIPVIVTTLASEPEAEKKALSMGATDFVTKPYDADIIKQRLANLIKLRETAVMVNVLQRDKLTGLWNRETFFDKAAWNIARQPEGYYVLSCVDIDNFKVINDQYGIEKGDEVLKNLAKVMRRDCDLNGGLCGRISADNFVALYPRHLLLRDELEAQKAKAASVPGLLMPVTLSTGRYAVTDKTLSVSAMYDRAALAQATVKGRYDVHTAFYDESMRSSILHQQAIVSGMMNALTANQFEAWFQPQYNHSTGAIIGAEALTRWRSPDKGLVSPLDFIPVFERNGFVYELDKYMWRQVCTLLRRWLDEGRSPLPVSVNISRYDLFRDDLTAVLTGLLREFRLPAELLRLEITESAFARSTERVVDIVKALIALGFTVEIDDFGSGYSSLNTLKEVPAQIVKLDMRFLEGGANSDRGGNILESMVRMTKWLGMSVIAEGVETMAQADFLRSIGCSYVQGFLYARPMPAGEYETLTAETGREEKLIVLETVDKLDNNAFWDPASMDTLIFNSYVGAACIFEYRGGKTELLRANEKYAKMFGEGVTLERAMSLSWDASMDAADAEKRSAAMLRAIESGQEASCEAVLRNIAGDGRDICVRSVMRVVASTGDRYLIYCYNESLTAQREAESGRESALEQLRAIMDNVSGGICASALDKDGKLRTVFANGSFYSMYGYTKEQFEAELDSPMDVILPEDLDEVMTLVRDLIKTGDGAEYSCRCRRRDGRIVHINCRNSVTSLPRVEGRVLLAVLTDVTELMEAREALRQSREEYSLAAALSDRSILRYDIKTRRLRLLSQGSGELSFSLVDGRPPEAVAEVFHLSPEHAAAAAAFFASAGNGVASSKTLLQGQDENGARRWSEWWYELTRGLDGAPVAAMISVEDVTERKRAEDMFNISSAFLDASEDVRKLMIVNLTTGELEYETSGPHGLLGRGLGALSGDAALLIGITKFVFGADRPEAERFFNAKRVLAQFETGVCEESLDYRSVGESGELRWMSVRTHVVRSEDTGDVKLYAIFSDIHQKKLEELELRRRARTDSLTGLMNRDSFEQDIKTRCHCEKGCGHFNALIMVDIDNFKQINDSFGHSAGDVTLKEVAARLRSALRDSDVVARYGGDEFIALLPKMPSIRQIEHSCARICRSLSFETADGFPVSASLGVAVCPLDGSDYETLTRQADKAMYTAKRAGGNRFSRYQ